MYVLRGFAVWALLLVPAMTGARADSSPVLAMADAPMDSTFCLDCHDDPGMVSEDGRRVDVTRALFRTSVHRDVDCIECHSAPGDYEEVPHYPAYVRVKCTDCHEEAPLEVAGSVHGKLFAEGDLSCLTCHPSHVREPAAGRLVTGCSDCHEAATAEYAESVHRKGRRRNGFGTATCAGCHGGHAVVAVADSTSPIFWTNIPNLCGDCHATLPAMTKDFVHLPVTLPTYLASVHGEGWKEGKHTAVCTDCHGVHDSRIAEDPKSHIHRRNISETCGQCHPTIAGEYDRSIHGRAVALGIDDSPTCTDCHAEHLIRRHSAPAARVSVEHRAKELCGDCHTDPELMSKYGVTAGVVETYLDSYHGWAIDRGSSIAATCTDCHNVHEIRSRLDPGSSIHADNVTETCRRCHADANQSFAHSYTHESALAARGAHGWVRLIYISLIAIVLGGMAIHNFIVARYEFGTHLKRRRREPSVVRWQRAERVQHLVLLLSFSALAITGFALRYPESWWVRLIGLGGHEYLRANLHRTFGIILIVQSIYHVLWLGFTRRGRWSLGAIAPRVRDAGQLVENMAFYLGKRARRPAFGVFDYTQKAEYWAVVWGTVVMALTGLILWYPTVATRWAPAWIVRVSEVIHFYEAVLAVSAIVIWHLFDVLFLPRNYPMSTVWLDGRMPLEEWKEMHSGQVDTGDGGPAPEAEAGNSPPDDSLKDEVSGAAGVSPEVQEAGGRHTDKN